MPSPKPKFRPLTGIYSDELNAIWAKDPRIPTHTSRKAWAIARGLNPTSVHNWWYRRRPRAKKLRIRIPSGTYDMEVGRIPTPPPTPPPKVKEEEIEEPNVCVESVQPGEVDQNAEKPEVKSESGVTETGTMDVCGEPEPDGLRLWTEEDGLEEFRSSMRSSSPSFCFSVSYFPSSDLDDFFKPSRSPDTPPSSPAFGAADIFGDDDVPLAKPAPPLIKDLANALERDSNRPSMSGRLGGTRSDSAAKLCDQTNSGGGSCASTVSASGTPATGSPDDEDSFKTACNDASKTALEAQPSEPTPTTFASILATEITEKVEFESLGPGLLDGFSFTPDVDWSLSAIPFLDRSRDWLIDEASTAGSRSSPTRFSSQRSMEIPLLYDCELDAGFTHHDTATVCIFGSRFTLDGSYSRRCACSTSCVCPTVEPKSTSGNAILSVSRPVPSDASFS